MDGFDLTIIGRVESPLRALAHAPRQGDEGAPDAWIAIDPAVAAGLRGLQAGDDIVLLSWLDRADRGTLEVRPRDDGSAPLTGVFATRSPHRPNPIGLHRVTVRAIEGTRLQVGPLEAVDGTPIVDIKIVWKDT